MRKITYLLSLCAALFVGTTQTSAQTTLYDGKGVASAGAAVSSVDEIQDGYYIVRNANRAASMYENASGKVMLDNSTTATNIVGTTDKMSRVIKISKTESGTYTFQFESGKFLPVIAESENPATSETAGDFNISALEIPEGKTVARFAVNNATENTDVYFNGNAEGGGWTFVGWESGDYTSNGAYEFYPVTLGDAVTLTYNLKLNGETISTIEVPAVTGGGLPAAPSYAYTTHEDPQGTVSAEQTSYDINYTATATPFKASDSYENATWYYLTLGGNLYLRDTNEADKMTISGNTSTDPSISDADLWAFVGNPISGFKIYNKQAGSTKILSSSTTMTGTNGSTTYPILVDEATLPEGNNTYWDATSSSYQTNGFFLGQHGYANNRMNFRSPDLAYWTGGADNGSTFVVTTISDAIPGLIAELYKMPLGTVGTLASLAEYKAEADRVSASKSEEDYRTLYNNIQANTELVPLETGKYYRLLNTYKGGRYLANVSNNFGAMTANETEEEARLDASTIVSFEGDEENGYKIKSEGLYISQAGKVSNSIGLTAAEADIDRFKLIPQDKNTFLLALESQTDPNPTNKYLHKSGSPDEYNTKNGAILHWSATAESSRWYIVPATDLDITLNDAGENSYATLYLPFAVEVADGVTAYTGQESADGSSINVTAIESGAVPANNGVLLVGAAGAGTVSLNIAADEAATLADNVFTGTNVATTISDANSYYIFGNGDNGVGFYHPAGTTLKANRAYIANTTGAAAASLKLVFGNNGETTGIEGIESAAGNADAPVYDLSGRRVAKAVKGIYIQNGKKIFVK